MLPGHFLETIMKSIRLWVLLSGDSHVHDLFSLLCLKRVAATMRFFNAKKLNNCWLLAFF